MKGILSDSKSTIVNNWKLHDMQVLNGYTYLITNVCLICVDSSDVCSTQPCMNGGTCHEIVGTFYCICDGAYAGDDCSIGELLSSSSK